MDLPVTPAYPTVAIADTTERLALHRIYCVGWNYAEHVREMGLAPEREPPIFFMKPLDAVVPDGGVVRYPPRTANLHYEVELVVAIGRGGADIPRAAALSHVWGYGVGIDMTRRDLQAHAKQRGQPWETSKAFDDAAPLGPLRAAADIGHPSTGRIWLAVNGTTRQDGDLAQLIWSVPEIIEQLSGYFRLAPGDLIYTGTPAGVGPVEPGDTLEGGIDGVGKIRVHIE